MTLILRQPRTAQPQSPAGVNWNNPITRGLVRLGNAAYASNGFLVDSADPTVSYTSATPGLGTNPGGKSLGKSQSVIWLGSSTRGQSAIGTGDFTVVMQGVDQSNNTSQYYCQIGDATNAAGYTYFGDRSGNVLAVNTFGGTLVTVAGHVQGALETLVIARRAGVLYFYVNGIYKGSGAHTSSIVNGPFCLSSTTGSQKETNVAGLFIRGLSDLECLSLSANVWQLFQPQSRQIWVPTAAGGTHTTTGALTADAATIAGTATHLTLHTTSGALAAQAATITGTALHPHTTSGALVAGNATIAGTATRAATGTHPTSGALAADAAVIAGTAVHLTLHTTTGALVAQSATIAGTAAGPVVLSVGGGGFLPQKSYKYRYKVDEKLDAIAPEVAQVIKSEAAIHVDDAKAVQVKTALRDLGIDYKKAYQQIYLELVQEMRQEQEDEQIVQAIASML